VREVGTPVCVAFCSVVGLETGFRGRHFEVHFVEDHPGWCVVENHKCRIEQEDICKYPNIMLVGLVLTASWDGF
jgi:hypothetical protein